MSEVCCVQRDFCKWRFFRSFRSLCPFRIACVTSHALPSLVTHLRFSVTLSAVLCTFLALFVVDFVFLLLFLFVVRVAPLCSTRLCLVVVLGVVVVVVLAVFSLTCASVALLAVRYTFFELFIVDFRLCRFSFVHIAVLCLFRLYLCRRRRRTRSLLLCLAPFALLRGRRLFVIVNYANSSLCLFRIAAIC